MVCIASASNSAHQLPLPRGQCFLRHLCDGVMRLASDQNPLWQAEGQNDGNQNQTSGADANEKNVRTPILRPPPAMSSRLVTTLRPRR